MWYVIHTHPKKESLALANIGRQGFSTFCPMFVCSYQRIGDRVRPLFPSYVFVEFDPEHDRWYPLMHTLGVKRLFATYPSQSIDGYGYLKPTPIPTDTIMSLQQQVLVQPAKLTTPVIQPGTQVRVVRGHFEGHQGICAWSSQKRIGLLMDVLNGKLEVSFTRESVELIDGT